MWWQGILQMLTGGTLVFLGFWAASRVAKGEPMIPRRPKPPPVPTYDRRVPREGERPEIDGMATREFEDAGTR